MFFSPYKATDDSNDCRCFVSKELAQEAMRREARRLYKNSRIIQGASDKYYYEFEMKIRFGESEGESESLVTVKLNVSIRKMKKVEIMYHQVRMMRAKMNN
jgi:hypothetical protein